MNSKLDRRVCLAPMMDWTDRFYRYFLRQITQKTVLYSEMVTTGAIIHGDRERHLQFDEIEHPVALQLGGSNPEELAQCTRIAEEWGYDEVNLNVGCPSDRVQSGRFGACLMAEKNLVAECVAKMQAAVKIPVTVKTRIGIDHQDSWEFFEDFVKTVESAGCDTFIVHARKAWLQGLSPKENREKPPLHYDTVYRLKEENPQLEIIINGGIQSVDESKSHLEHVDGVMIGREIYGNPFAFAEVDSQIYGVEDPSQTREEVLRKMQPYIEGLLAEGHPLNRISRHMLGLYHGVRGGRLYRRMLTEKTVNGKGDWSLIEEWLQRQ